MEHSYTVAVQRGPDCACFRAHNDIGLQLLGIAAAHKDAVQSLESTPSPERSLCDGLQGAYSYGWHISGLVIILLASLTGVLLPIMTKRVAFLRNNPFSFIVGKTVATGVLLSVSTIHLIHEAEAAFREDCVPKWVSYYEGYAFLIALIGALLMQALDIELVAIGERWIRQQHHSRGDVVIESSGPTSSEVTCQCHESSRLADRYREELCGTSKQVVSAGQCEPTASCVLPPAVEDRFVRQHTHDTSGSHGHQHLWVEVPRDMGAVRRVIAAVSMEFGVTLHSVFVGLAVGLTTDAELKPLLVALVFHQSFEGMAMGARLVDAKFHGRLESVLALIFTLSAPMGMASAIVAVSVSRDAMSGGTFVLVMAILDAFCGGILLYLAFSLLVSDFPADLRLYCPEDTPGSQGRKVCLFVALWLGMLLMAAVGKWL